MASPLGYYTHLSFENYKEYGTNYPDEKSKRTNYSTSIFYNHQITTQRIAKRLKDNRIKGLEKEYNNQVKKVIAEIEKFLNDPNVKQEDKNYFKQLIAETSHFSDFKADAIKNKLGIDSTTGLFQYKGTNNALVAGGKSKLRIDTRSGSTIAGTKDRKEITKNRINTLINRCEEAYKIVEATENVDQQSKNIILKKINFIKNTLEGYKKSADVGNALLNRYKSLLNFSDDEINTLKQNLIDNKYFRVDATQVVLKKLNLLLLQVLSASKITTRINQEFVENEGNYIANNINAIGISTIIDYFEKLKKDKNFSVGRQMSQVRVNRLPMITSGPIFEGYMDKIEKMLKKEEEEGEIQIEDNQQNKGSVKYSLFRDYSVQQKADVVYEFKNATFNISMKNTNLKDEFRTQNGNPVPNTIELQNSSLLLFLAGIENEQPDMGTHYLNLLVEHDEEEKDATWAMMRNQAINGLKMSLLYSALTGNRQMRISGKNANVLAIYDKDPSLPEGTSRVKFFDMGRLVEEAAKDFDKAVIFETEDYDPLEKIFLPNNRLGDQHQNERIPAIQRVAKIIIEARLIKIKASLRKDFLNKIYRAP